MSNYKPKGYPLAMRLMALEVLESLDSSPRKLEQNLDFAEEEIKANNLTRAAEWLGYGETIIIAQRLDESGIHELQELVKRYWRLKVERLLKLAENLLQEKGKRKALPELHLLIHSAKIEAEKGGIDLPERYKEIEAKL